MDVPKPVSSQSSRFMDQFVIFLRARGLAYRTEKTYCQWVLRFIRYQKYSEASQMRVEHIVPFLNHLVVDRHCSINTQRTALNALVCLFREFMQMEVGELMFDHARKPRKLPTVLTSGEAQAVIAHLSGNHRLQVQLMYGSGLRVMETVRLRVKDVDFSNSGLFV